MAAGFADGDLTGCLFRHLNGSDANLIGAKLAGTRWLHCQLAKISGLLADSPGVDYALCQPEQFVSHPPTLVSIAAFTGHSQAITACAFSQDGLTLASASYDHTLRLWDTASGDCRAILEGHKYAVTGCAFSPDGLTLASASKDQSLRLWDSASGDCRAILKGHESYVTGCAFSPDGLTLASASYDHTLRLWDTASGDCRAILKGHEGTVTGCAYSPDGRVLLSAAADGSLRLWDVSSGQPLRQYWMFDATAWASLDVRENRVLMSGGEAWRWLGWQAIDPVSQRLTRYPAEAFGPLPSKEISARGVT